MDATDPSTTEARRCTAHRKNGDRCKRAPIRGGAVCRFHGGAAPQVQKAAAIRLAELVDPAIRVYNKHLRPRNPRTVNEQLQYKAAKDVMVGTGMFKPKQELTLNTAFDEGRFKNLNDAELAQLITLGRKITLQTDARDA